MTDGYDAMEHDDWAVFEDAIAARYAGRAWPEAAARQHLRWLLGERWTGRMKASAFPTVRALAERWTWKVPTAARFIEDTARWQCEGRRMALVDLRGDRAVGVNRARDGGETAVRRERDGGETVATGERQENIGTRDGGETAVRRERDGGETPCATTPRASTDHQITNPEPPPPPQGGESCVEPVVEQQVLVPAVVEPPAPPAVVDPVPSWVPTRKDLGGADRHATWMGVVATLTVVHGEPVNPYRCKTDGAEIVKFWIAQGKRLEERPPVLEFLDDLALVARAFRACPHPMFARHVRAEGWPDGTNRMDHVPTLVVRSAWGSRLREAQRWRDAGFPETWGGTGPPGVEDEAARKKRRLEERLRKIEQGDDD